jgi:hypothetical protein
MLLARRIAMGALACFLLAESAAAQEKVLSQPAQLKRLTKPGDYRVHARDLLLFSVESNPSTGPSNPAANLKAKVTGEAVKYVSTVFVPPAKPIPGAPGRLQAFFLAERPGNATIEITLINGQGVPGDPATFKIMVGRSD